MRERLSYGVVGIGAGAVLAGSFFKWLPLGCVVLLGYQEPGAPPPGCAITFWQLMTVADVVLALATSLILVAVLFSLVRQPSGFGTLVLMTAGGVVLGILTALGSPVEGAFEDNVDVRGGGKLALAGAAAIVVGAVLLQERTPRAPALIRTRATLGLVALLAPLANALPTEQDQSLWTLLQAGDVCVLVFSAALLLLVSRPATSAHRAALLAAGAIAGAASVHSLEFVGLRATDQLFRPLQAGVWANLFIAVLALVGTALVAFDRRQATPHDRLTPVRLTGRATLIRL